jgi:hypothetical protein
MLENAAESHTSGAPNQDGGPSFFPKGHDELCPENSNMIGVRDHFRPKKPPSKDTRRRIMIMAEGSSPYNAMVIDLFVRSPVENFGMRRNDFSIGGVRLRMIEPKRPRLGSCSTFISRAIQS